MVEYRNLQPSDYDDVIRIWTEAGLGHRPQGRDSREAVTAEMIRTPELYIGAFSDNRLIGTIVGTYDGRRGCVNRLAVAPQFRKSGIAERLVALCEERLQVSGALLIFGLIDRENIPSQSLFAKLGYHHHEDILYFSKRMLPES
jgi:ribosomal protein S18 acetylase RimI-like enzyme